MTIEEIEAARPDYQKHLDNLNQRFEYLVLGRFAPQSIGFRDYESARLHLIGEINKAEETLRKIDEAIALALNHKEEDELSEDLGHVIEDITSDESHRSKEDLMKEKIHLEALYADIQRGRVRWQMAEDESPQCPNRRVALRRLRVRIQKLENEIRLAKEAEAILEEKSEPPQKPYLKDMPQEEQDRVNREFLLPEIKRTEEYIAANFEASVSEDHKDFHKVQHAKRYLQNCKTELADLEKRNANRSDKEAEEAEVSE